MKTIKGYEPFIFLLTSRYGKRFLMMKPAATIDDESTSIIPRKINIVLNWLEELKQRVPVK